MVAAIALAWSIVFALSPFFTSYSPPQFHIFVLPEYSFHEIETLLYTAITGLSIALFGTLSVLFVHFERKTEPFKTALRSVAIAFLLYILLYPVAGIIQVLYVPYFILFLFLVVLVSEIFFLRRPPPFSLLLSLILLVLFKYAWTQFFLFDAVEWGTREIKDYIPAIIAFAFVTIVYMNSPNLLRIFIKSPRMKIVVFAITVFTIVISFIPFISVCDDYQNVYFTLLPAYHLAKGGAPFVSMMSQYGVLYLAPWVVLKILFPTLQMGAATGFIITPFLVIGFFLCFAWVAFTIIKNHFIAACSVFSCMFYTLLYRTYLSTSFAPLYAMTCSPSFTPLRFGPFLIPLVFLWRYISKKNPKDLLYFGIASSVLFFFSFEVGSGIFVSGIIVGSIAFWFLAKNNQLRLVLQYLLVCFTTLISAIAIFVLYGYIKTGNLPDLQMYTLFSKIFSSGYMMTPITNEMSFLVPVFASIVGLVLGTSKLLKKENKGLLYIYLSLLQLMILPYFTGHSMQFTLFGLLMEMFLLVGIIIDDAIQEKPQGIEKPFYQTILVLYGFLLAMGSVRFGQSLVTAWAKPVTVVQKQLTYVKTAMHSWPVTESNEYGFLRQYMPKDCPLVLFSEQAGELLPALNVVPAYEYSFLRGFVFTQEQIDGILAKKRQPYCLYMNRTDFESGNLLTKDVYAYFWSKLASHATLIAKDDTLRLELYTIDGNPIR